MSINRAGFAHPVLWICRRFSTIVYGGDALSVPRRLARTFWAGRASMLERSADQLYPQLVTPPSCDAVASGFSCRPKTVGTTEALPWSVSWPFFFAVRRHLSTAQPFLVLINLDKYIN